ncbi:MAG: hypothetical protein K9N55_16815 [Phycisphaerae bacterium]|nr:hypothetical protein [Phycisphaerae bacterium]
MDLEAKGTYYEQITSQVRKETPNTLKIKDFESTSAFLQIGLGLAQNWDIYGCIGANNAKGDATVESPSQPNTFGFGNGETFGIDNKHDLAWGVGTRFTLKKYDTVDWGGLVQMTWLNPRVGASQWTSVNDSTYRINGDWDLDYWEIIAAFGPTIYYENIAFYGGPFIQIVRGDMTLDGAYVYQNNSNTGTASASQDLEEESMIGGYAGMMWDLTDRMLIHVDGRFTANAWGAGIGILLRQK